MTTETTIYLIGKCTCACNVCWCILNKPRCARGRVMEKSGGGRYKGFSRQSSRDADTRHKSTGQCTLTSRWNMLMTRRGNGKKRKYGPDEPALGRQGKTSWLHGPTTRKWTTPRRNSSCSGRAGRQKQQPGKEKTGNMEAEARNERGRKCVPV